MNERSLTMFRSQKPLLLAVITETDERTEQDPKLKPYSKLDSTQGYASAYVCFSLVAVSCGGEGTETLSQSGL